jgi:hypothetical protein
MYGFGMATRPWPALALALAFACGPAGCGGAGTSQQPTQRATTPSAQSRACPTAPHSLTATLRDGARGVSLGRVFAVRSHSSFEGRARAVRAGVYFVSADLGVVPVVGTWVANERAFRSGQGLILAVDKQARSASPGRWKVAPGVLASRFGIDAHTDGFARSRNCANPTRLAAK